jgi:hypothetical protein
MSRRSLFAVALASTACLAFASRPAEAQFFPNGGADPFSLYFGYYLPHAAAVAATPTPLDTINQLTAARQFQAVTDRAGLYDPISPYGEQDIDPLRPSGDRKGERMVRPQQFAVATSNARGQGPALYYNRTARYYPQLRVGRGPNRNLGAVRSGRGGGVGGGMMGMPSMPSPGPR